MIRSAAYHVLEWLATSDDLDVLRSIYSSL
jgi:hypothetical protein